MEDEAVKLLREIRDIGLRNEARIDRDMAWRKRIVAVILLVVAIAIGALAYLFYFLDTLVTEPREQRAVISSQPSRPDSRHSV